MSSTSAPFGFQPIYHSSGYVRPEQMTLPDNCTTTLLQYMPVKIAAGVVDRAAAGDTFVGTFMGVEFTDSDGRRRVSNKWIANNIGTNIICYITLDPQIVYRIQSNGTLAVDDIGEQFDFTVTTAGSTTTGLSAVMLDTATSAANAQLRVIGKSGDIDNEWGDSYVIVDVQISEHQNVANKAAY
jgi:hypothetical protein